MASADVQTPTCPVCHQSDEVKTMQAAYDSGVSRCAPPDLPTRNVRMFSYITACIILVGICVFLIITLIGGQENRFPQVLQLTLLIITLLVIISVLGISYYAFQRIVRGDNEAAELYPAYDKAMDRWRHLYYCARNDTVFDSQTQQVISDQQLADLHVLAKANDQDQAQSAIAQH
jgi:hypothetical protein